MRHRPARSGTFQRGMSLIELMLGITVGMFVVAAASYMLVNHLDDNRRLILETQVQQDLRAALELITRDLRRAGYWGAADLGVWQRDNTDRILNPYAEVTTHDEDEVPRVEYLFSLDDQEGREENSEVDEDENSGFRLGASGAIEMKLGAAWQQMTDPSTLKITRFDIVPTIEVIDLIAFCPTPCPDPADCPKHKVRSYQITVEGEAANDPRVKRELNTTVRVRNDDLQGLCPS